MYSWLKVKLKFQTPHYSACFQEFCFYVCVQISLYFCCFVTVKEMLDFLYFSEFTAILEVVFTSSKLYLKYSFIIINYCHNVSQEKVAFVKISQLYSGIQTGHLNKMCQVHHNRLQISKCTTSLILVVISW